MLHFELCGIGGDIPVYRAKVPGGWLVAVKYIADVISNIPRHAYSITFYPDPDHYWNGSSLP